MLTVQAADAAAGIHSQGQDSLIRLLLGIDKIQPSVISILLEKLLQADSYG